MKRLLLAIPLGWLLALPASPALVDDADQGWEFSFAPYRVKLDVKLHVGPAKVEDTQYTFFAKGVGKVAEIEALRVSAALIYHSHRKTAKVLVTHPAAGG